MWTLNYNRARFSHRVLYIRVKVSFLILLIYCRVWVRFQVLLFHWWEFISLLLGLSEMSRETMRVEESRRTEQKICSQLFFKTKNALQRLNSLQK